MIKYYGIWDKEENEWSDWSWPQFPPDIMIGKIHLWSDKNRLQKEIESLRSQGFSQTRFPPKVKEFTPIDALLAKCGKI